MDNFIKELAILANDAYSDEQKDGLSDDMGKKENSPELEGGRDA